MHTTGSDDINRVILAMIPKSASVMRLTNAGVKEVTAAALTDAGAMKVAASAGTDETETWAGIAAGDAGAKEVATTAGAGVADKLLVALARGLWPNGSFLAGAEEAGVCCAAWGNQT